ncbi:hypothetical protein BDZ89DRAFT_1047969 [Hymenopellis radicata]|nr:hypothetical protein BDZ89DRAFT_1047969 [Hymenopellis radicata]
MARLNGEVERLKRLPTRRVKRYERNKRAREKYHKDVSRKSYIRLSWGTNETVQAKTPEDERISHLAVRVPCVTRVLCTQIVHAILAHKSSKVPIAEIQSVSQTADSGDDGRDELLAQKKFHAYGFLEYQEARPVPESRSCAWYASDMSVVRTKCFDEMPATRDVEETAELRRTSHLLKGSGPAATRMRE